MRLCCLQSEVNACARHAAAAENALPPRESLSESLSELTPSRAFSPRAIKSSARRILYLSFYNSSLNKLQSKLTNRHPRVCHHTALGESPRTPLPCKDRRKAPPQKHFAVHSLRDLHPSLVSACRLHSRLDAVRLGSASREPGPSGPPRKRRRGYESALLASWVLLTRSGRTRGGRSTILGASWAQGMCKGHSSWSIDMRLLVSRLRMGGTLLDGAYS